MIHGSAQESQAAFDKALKAREPHEVVFATIGGPKLKDIATIGGLTFFFFSLKTWDIFLTNKTASHGTLLGRNCWTWWL